MSLNTFYKGNWIVNILNTFNIISFTQLQTPHIHQGVCNWVNQMMSLNHQLDMYHILFICLHNFNLETIADWCVW